MPDQIAKGQCLSCGFSFRTIVPFGVALESRCNACGSFTVNVTKKDAIVIPNKFSKYSSKKFVG